MIATEDYPQWECLTCARKCNVVADDNCPACGTALPVFIEYRTDGWPLCPRCGEDELYSHLNWDGNEPRPTVAEYIAAGMKCYRCNHEISDR